MTSISVGAGAGSGASVSLDANADDNRGNITINTGAGVGANPTLASVAFGSALPSVPYIYFTRTDQVSPIPVFASVIPINVTENGFDLALSSNGTANLSSIDGISYNYNVVL